MVLSLPSQHLATLIPLLFLNYRLPQNVNDNVDEDPTGTKSLWDRGLLSGASQKAETVSVFFAGETILSLQKANLIPGGNDSLVSE